MFFSYPYLAADSAYDHLNRLLAIFTSKMSKNSERRYAVQLLQSIMSEIDHAVKILTVEDSKYPVKRMVASVNLSHKPLDYAQAMPSLFQELRGDADKIDKESVEITRQILNIVEKGDAGLPYLYPQLYLKLGSSDLRRDADLLSGISRILLKWKTKHNLFVVNADWPNGSSNAAYGEFMGRVHGSSKEPDETQGVGMCGLVSINLPRVALRYIHENVPETDALEEYVSTAVRILDNHRQRLAKIYDRLYIEKMMPFPLNLKKSVFAIGVLGLKEYIEIHNLDPSDAEGRDLALETLDSVEAKLKRLTDEKGGKWMLAETFAPSQMFADNDRQRYGTKINEYTPGCSLVTNRLFLAQDIDVLIKAATFEKPLHDRMKGGGLAYQIHLGGEITEEQLGYLVTELLAQGIHGFKLIVE